MKASFSIVNSSCAGSKLVPWINRISKYCSAGNTVLSSFLEEDQYILENFISIDNDDPLPNIKCISAESKKSNEIFPSGNDKREFLAKDDSMSKNQKAADEVKTIKLILTKRIWNIHSQNGYKIDLNEFSIMQILNDVFEESLDAELALYFFRWSECCTETKHSIRLVSRMIHILVCGNMNYRAMDLILHLVRSNGEIEGWHDLLLKVLYETHTERRALQFVYSMLVNCYVKENMIDMALKSICQVKHLHIFPSIGVCNSLLRALLRSARLELAWDLWEEMNCQGIGFNASIFSLFIHYYCAKGDLESGLKLLIYMRDQGIKPDVITYTIVINTLCKTSYLKEATTMLFKLTQMGISLDSVLISSVIDGYCKEGKSEEALGILKVFNFSPNVFVYNSVLSKLCTDGDMVKAFEVFYEMSEWDLHPDCFSYTTIIGGYCKLWNTKKALEFLGKMLKRGIIPSVVTYTSLIDSWCKSGDIEMAEYMFQKMTRQGLVPDVVAYNTLMDGYGKQGFLHKAFELLNMMGSANVSPNIVTYNILIHSLITGGYLNGAKIVLDELIRRGFSPDVVTLTNLLDHAVSKKGNFEDAYRVWRYMSEQRVKPDIVICSALINGYCRARLVDKANDLFCSFINDGLIPDLILYNTLIHGFCSVGNVGDACHLVSTMVKHGTLPNDATLRAIVLGFERKGVSDPVKSSAYKLQELLLDCGIHVDVNQYLAMMQKPGSYGA